MFGKLQTTYEFAFIFGKPIQIKEKWFDSSTEILFSLSLLMVVMQRLKMPILFLNSLLQRKILMIQYIGALVHTTGKASIKK
jgi:hypothetical protein